MLAYKTIIKTQLRQKKLEFANGSPNSSGGATELFWEVISM